MCTVSNGEWTTKNNNIYYNDQLYRIRGVNWFGSETDCRVPLGMWVQSLDWYLDTLRGYGFNSLRIPFSYENAQTMDVEVKQECVSACPSLQGQSMNEAFHRLFRGAQERQMTILLDFHTINGHITEYPTTDIVNEDMVLETWVSVLNGFGSYPNLIGIDIKNEPHGNIRWPGWGSFVQRAIDYISGVVPTFTGLFFVEGIQDPADMSVWGGSFRNIDDVFGPVPNPRIVFSPHVYGPSVRGSTAISDDKSRWTEWFAFLQDKYQNPVCIGEIGGWFEGDDRTWHYQILEFLQQNNISNAYYWCLNPNSIDTGGIFEYDWTTINQEKIAFCKQLQPNPVFLSFS